MGTLKSRQIDKKTTFQIRVDRGWRKMLFRLKAEYGRSFKELTELALSELYGGVNAEELKEVLGDPEDA